MVVMFPCDALSLPTDYVGQLAAVRMAGSTGLSGYRGAVHPAAVRKP